MGERLRRRLLSGDGFDRELADRALELGPEAGRLSVYESPERSVGTILALLDQVEEARPLLEGSLQRAVDGGEIEGEIGILIHLAELEIRAGRWQLADGYIRRNVEVERFSGLPDLAYALGILAHVSALLGRVEEARRAGEEGSALAAETGQQIFRILNEHALGFLDLSLGDVEAAARRLAPLPDEQLSIGIGDPTIFPVLPDAIEALIAVGDLELAETYVERLEADGRRLDRPLALCRRRPGRALLAEVAGKPEDALESIERALAEVERLGSAFQLGRTLLVEGRIHRRERRKGKAKARLEQALDRVRGARGGPLGRARAGGARPGRPAPRRCVRAHGDRGEGRRAGRSRPHEPRGRRRALPEREDRRGLPDPDLPEARRPLEDGAGERPPRAEPEPRRVRGSSPPESAVTGSRPPGERRA